MHKDGQNQLTGGSDSALGKIKQQDSAKGMICSKGTGERDRQEERKHSCSQKFTTS